MKDLGHMSEAALLETIELAAANATRAGWPDPNEQLRQITAATAELRRRRSADPDADQEIEHRWGSRDADIFRLDEYGNIVHLRGEHGRRYWTYPEGYDRAYLAAITLALAITAGYQPGAPG